MINNYFFVTVLLYFLIINASHADINEEFAAHRQYSNARFNGLSNAGCAIPENITSVFLNPALIHSWHLLYNYKYSVGAGYASDSVFSKYVINTGASWQINELTSVGALYRAFKQSTDMFQDDILLCVAGRLFDKSLEQGAVNLGMNMRIENCHWENNDLDSLKMTWSTPYNTTDKDSSWYYAPSSFLRQWQQRRWLFDIGFFQDNIFQGMDFGLTLHDIFTYTWTSEYPTLTDTAWSLTDSIDLDSSYYASRWNDAKGRDNKVYKRLTVGIAYHADILQDKAKLLIPLDIEFLGLFDRKQKMKLGLHTGIEGWFINKICLRFGYAYAPNYIQNRPGKIKFNNDHIISGGASIRIEPVGIDVYIKKQDWGIGAFVAF